MVIESLRCFTHSGNKLKRGTILNRYVLRVCISCALLLEIGCTAFGHGRDALSPDTTVPTANGQVHTGGGRGISGDGE